MKRTAIALFTGWLCLAAGWSSTAVAQEKPDFPKFEDVSKGHEKIISSAGGDSGMYTLYQNKNGHILVN